MAAKFEIFQDKSGGYRFNLKAGNGEIVATSESYTTKDAAKKGADAVRRAAAEAETVDTTA
jgi:uncharacterized protein YegP (UPF0339 family)